MTILPSLPVVQRMQVDLEPEVCCRLEGLAERLLASEPILSQTDMFGPNVAPGLLDAPALFFEDHSEVALFREHGDLPLEYRSYLLSRQEDIFVIGGQRFPEFEAYCRNVLGLGAGTVAKPEAQRGARLVPLSLRCLRDSALYEKICLTARRRGRFNIVPYMGTGNVWRLAAAIASQTRAQICVAAAPPRLTRRVNNKLWFLERIRETLGSTAPPLTYSVFGPAALASRVRTLASQFPQVAVKVPDSSGSMGDVMIRSEEIAGKPLAHIRRQILDTLLERRWRHAYPLLVGVWDHPVLASPSVNLWIPRREEGPPVVEWLFIQSLSGENAEFVGAEPSDLPRHLEARIAWEAMCIGQYFQYLGYSGRCGFDTILVGDSLETASTHWIECNGRWGGVSIPITVANRLLGDWSRKFPIIVQFADVPMPPRSLPEILKNLDGHLIGKANTDRGVVLIAPGRLVDGSGMNLIVIADTKRAAWEELGAVTHILLT